MRKTSAHSTSVPKRAVATSLPSKAIVYINIVRLLLKHLDHFADAFGGALAEEKPRPILNKLGLTEEAEDDGAPVVSVEAARAQDSLYHSCLPHVSDVHCGLEPSTDAGGVVQNLCTCLWGRSERTHEGEEGKYRGEGKHKQGKERKHEREEGKYKGEGKHRDGKT